MDAIPANHLVLEVDQLDQLISHLANKSVFKCSSSVEYTNPTAGF